MKVFSFDAVDQGVVGMMVVNSDGKYNSHFLIDNAIILVFLIRSNGISKETYTKLCVLPVFQYE